MHREPLLHLLARADSARPEDRARVARIRALVEARVNCFDRDCLPGHVTGSCWILSPDGGRFLMTQHRKLRRWLQLGGHADGDPDIVSVAVREAREESGMEHFEIATEGGLPVVIDVDVHMIPARAAEPRHEHHDIRFLLRAAPGQSLERSDESTDLRWFPLDRFGELCQEDSLRRLGERAQRWGEGGSGTSGPRRWMVAPA